MAAATRRITTNAVADGGPQESTTITATVAEEVFEDLAIPGGKLAAGSVLPSKTVGSGTAAAGSIAVPMVAFADMPDGASEVEIVVPVKSKVAMVPCVKTGGAGAAGDAIQVRSATGGGGNLIATVDMSAAADTDNLFGVIDDSVNAIAAGASLFILGVAGAGDNSGEISILLAPVL